MCLNTFFEYDLINYVYTQVKTGQRKNKIVLGVRLFVLKFESVGNTGCPNNIDCYQLLENVSQPSPVGTYKTI